MLDSGRYAITASSDNSIRLTNIITGDERFRVKEVHRNSYPNAVAVTSSGFIVSCGKNGEIRLFEQTLGRHRGSFWGHASQINGVEEVPGDAIVTCGDDAKLKFWRIFSNLNLDDTEGFENSVDRGGSFNTKDNGISHHDTTYNSGAKKEFLDYKTVLSP